MAGTQVAHHLMQAFSSQLDEDPAMRHPYDCAGFDEAILRSDDDFEPYGFVQPQLAACDTLSRRDSQRPAHFNRVIEAAALRQLRAD